MSVAKVIEISAQSPEGFDAALQEGINRATDSVREVRSAWISSQEVILEEGRIAQYRVNLKITFKLQK